jgi:hypothetical protein
MGVDIQRFADLLVTRTELSQQAQHPL